MPANPGIQERRARTGPGGGSLDPCVREGDTRAGVTFVLSCPQTRASRGGGRERGRVAAVWTPAFAGVTLVRGCAGATLVLSCSRNREKRSAAKPGRKSLKQL